MKRKEIKMKNKLLFLSIIAIIATSCNYNKSIKKDFLTGIMTKGNNITCDNIYLTIDNKNETRNTFYYGEVFIINYENIEGFVKVNGNDFPGMSITVLNSNNDTILYEPDLYKEYSTEGINFNPLIIQAMLTAAYPMHTGNKYTMLIHIWDKKGVGTYDSKFEFTLKENEKIKTEAINDAKYDEIYLYSYNTEKVITDNKIPFNNTVYIVYEGLSGFKDIDGRINFGLSLVATDNNGKIILNYPDLYENKDATIEEFNKLIAPYFEFTGDKANNPISCTATLWDKNSDSKIVSEIILDVE